MITLAIMLVVVTFIVIVGCCDIGGYNGSAIGSVGVDVSILHSVWWKLQNLNLQNSNPFWKPNLICYIPAFF